MVVALGMVMSRMGKLLKMDVETDSLAIRIRTFLRDLLGSRLLDHMERELMQVRADYETRLLERERVIADLRADLAALQSKLDRYELVLLPLVHPRPSAPRPVTLQETREPRQSSWAEVQAEWDREQAELAAKEKGA